MNNASSAGVQAGSNAAVMPVQDAGLVRWATWLKYAGYLFLVLAITPIFLAEQYRRIGGLLLIPGLTLWWLCLTVRHGCLAWAWPAGSPPRRRGLIVAGVLSLPLVLLLVGLLAITW